MILPKIVENNQTYIIAGGFVLGAISIFGYLPETTDLLGLADRVKYVYFAYLAFCAYLLFRKAQGRVMPRTVISRDLSNPQYRQNLGQQYQTGGRGGLHYQPSNIRRDIPPSVNEQFRRER